MSGNTTWLVQGATRARREYQRFGVPRYALDNANDDHAVAGRKDYSVAMSGASPPAAGFENTEQTASCEEGYTGDDVVVAAGQYGGASQEAADAAALAAAEAGLSCVLPSFDGQITGTSGEVHSLAELPDGRILAGGSYTTISGVAQAYLALLFADGSVDVTFAPVLNGAVRIVRLISGSRVLILGDFTSVNGSATRQRIAILNLADGSLDAFAATLSTGIAECLGDGCELAGGDILVADNSTIATVNGVAWNQRFARFSSAGVHQTSFNPASGGAAGVSALLPYSNGKILVGGGFSDLAGNTAFDRLGLLNDDGTADGSWSCSVTGTRVYRLKRAADGNIWVAGQFTALGGNSRSKLGKINDAGAVQAFNPTTIGASTANQIGFVSEQADGKIVLSGFLAEVDSVTMDGVARLNSDGTRDTSWPDVGAFGNDVRQPRSLALSNGNILLGHPLSQTVQGESRDGMSLLEADGDLFALPA